MQFTWRPDAFLELVRAAIPVAVLFGFINWTPEMQAGATLVIGLAVAYVTTSFMTVDTKTLEVAGTSKVQVREAAAKNVEAGTPGGTGTPGEPGGSGGPTAPGGLGNMSSQNNRGTGSGMLRRITATVMILALVLSAACSRPITPAGAASTTKDVLTLANDVHRDVFDGYVAGKIPGPVADPFMDAVEKALIPAARKTVVALKAWQAASTVDMKKIKAGDVAAALTALDGVVLDLLGKSLPPGIAASVADTAASLRRSIDAIKAAIADARAGAPAPDVNLAAVAAVAAS